jgi:RNA polymerase sigma-70 factor (ECF subfamily)
MLSSPETAALVSAIALGDRRAFEQFYAATGAKVYGVVLRILRRHDLAIAVMEDTYEQVWQKAGEFDPAQQPSAVSWIVAIARARSIDLARLPETAQRDGDPEIADAVAPGTVPRRQMTDDLKHLLTCIGRLEPDRQRMVLLAYFGALTRDQLAARLDMPTNVLTPALRRSLFEIEQCLTA